MKILLNPKNGTTIKDFIYKFNKYFEAGAEFTPGKIIKMDDDVANAVLNTFGFIQEQTPNEAKKIVEKGDEEFKCDKCDFVTTAKVALAGHSKTHVNDEALDGIPVIKKEDSLKVDDTKKDVFTAGETEDKAAGLEGEGLVEESPRKSVVMK